jgi:diadenosine tetraphosphate (Ap4A) HIT family hydrolase
VPKKHYPDFLNIPPDMLQKLILATQKIALIYKDKLGIEQLQIINSCGSE